MTKILLDSSILLSNPEILSRSAADVEFLVLPQVLDEVREAGRHYKGTEDILRLVHDAIGRGSVKLLDAATVLGPDESAETARDTDGMLLQVLEQFDAQNESAFIASNDGQLTHVVRDAGLDGRSAQKTLSFLAERQATTLQDIRAKADATKQRSFRYAVRSFLSSVVVSLLVNVAYEYRNTILRTINIWATVVAVPAVGVGFYWLRARYRLTYGFVEFLIGLISALRVFVPTVDYRTLDQANMLQVVGGIYIMVRGMDNIGKGVGGTRWQPIWHRIFAEG